MIRASRIPRHTRIVEKAPPEQLVAELSSRARGLDTKYLNNVLLLFNLQIQVDSQYISDQSLILQLLWRI